MAIPILFFTVVAAVFIITDANNNHGNRNSLK